MKSRESQKEGKKELNNLNPLISIIVPVYNVEQYLSKCLESILNQTYKNIEVILINDGSTDNSKEICSDYSKRDKRIKVIHQKNEGLSVTRNVGIKKARGEYIGFVDSDDWILPEMYENLLKLSLENDADIVQCQAFTNENEDIYSPQEKVKILTKDEFMPLILKDEITSHIWRNLYRKKVLQKIVFPKGYVAQDMMVFHLIANQANKIVQTNSKFYYYYLTRADNTSNNPKGTFKGTMCRAIAFSNRYSFCLSQYPYVDQVLLKKSVRFTIAAFYRSKKDDSIKYQSEMNKLFGFIHQHRQVIKESRNISLGEKAAVNLLLTHKPTFIFFSKVLKISKK